VTQEEAGHRKRRRRRGRRGGAGRAERHDAAQSSSAKPGQKQSPAQPAQDEWKWLTFPVFFAFGLGVVIMGLAYPEPLIGFFVFVAGIGVVAFGLAHLVARRWIASRRQRD